MGYPASKVASDRPTVLMFSKEPENRYYIASATLAFYLELEKQDCNVIMAPFDSDSSELKYVTAGKDTYLNYKKREIKLPYQNADAEKSQYTARLIEECRNDPRPGGL